MKKTMHWLEVEGSGRQVKLYTGMNMREGKSDLGTDNYVFFERNVYT